MNSYIVLSGDGFTLDKNENIVENFQVVEFINAKTIEDVIDVVKLQHSDYLSDSFDNFMVYKLDSEKNHKFSL